MEPTNRELKLMLDNQTEKYNEKHQDLMDILTDIKTTAEETRQRVAIQNGRIVKMEAWSVEAQKVIEATSKTAADISKTYGIDKAKFWTAIAVIGLLGSTIITLTIMVIDNKIKKVVEQALLNTDITIQQIND